MARLAEIRMKREVGFTIGRYKDWAEVAVDFKLYETRELAIANGWDGEIKSQEERVCAEKDTRIVAMDVGQ